MKHFRLLLPTWRIFTNFDAPRMGKLFIMIQAERDWLSPNKSPLFHLRADGLRWDSCAHDREKSNAEFSAQVVDGSRARFEEDLAMKLATSNKLSSSARGHEIVSLNIL